MESKSRRQEGVKGLDFPDTCAPGPRLISCSLAAVDFQSGRYSKSLSREGLAEEIDTMWTEIKVRPTPSFKPSSSSATLVFCGGSILPLSPKAINSSLPAAFL